MVKMDMENATEKSENCLLSENETEEECSLFKQLTAVSGGFLLSLCFGMVHGFSAILFPQLEKGDSITINIHEKAILASIIDLLTVIGSITGGWSIDKIGRKRTNKCISITLMISWAFILASTSFPHLLVGRMLSGLCLGLNNMGVGFFISEVSHPKYRALFMTTTYASASIGVLFVNLLGTFLSWKHTSIVTLCVAAISLAALFLPPESHTYYVNKNKFEKAKKSFLYFRGNNAQSRKEWQKIYNDQLVNTKPSFRKLLKDCRSSKFTKPLSIAFLLFITCEMTGYKTFSYYCIDIMRQAMPHMNEYVAMISIDIIRIFMSVGACVLVKRYRVRPLVLTSGFGSGVSLLGMALFKFLAVTYPPNSTYFSFFATVCLFTYVIFVNVGLLPLHWTVASEIFHPDVKGIAGALITTVHSLTSFGVVQINPLMLASIGSEITFVIYATLTIIGTSTLVVFLPETKNKSLKEIEVYFIKAQ